MWYGTPGNAGCQYLPFRAQGGVRDQGPVQRQAAYSRCRLSIDVELYRLHPIQFAQGIDHGVHHQGRRCFTAGQPLDKLRRQIHQTNTVLYLSRQDLASLGQAGTQSCLFRPLGPGRQHRLYHSLVHILDDLAPFHAQILSSLPQIPQIHTQGHGLIRTAGIGNTATRIPFANHFIKYSLTDAYTNFDIVNGHFITRNGKALGCNLNVALQLDLNLVDMTLHGNLWPKINSIPTIILSPITVLSDFMFDIVVDGPVDDLSWSLGLDAKLKNKETGKEEHQKVRLPSRRIRQKEPAQS